MHDKHREVAAVEGRPTSEREWQAAGRGRSVGAWTGMSIKCTDSCRRATTASYSSQEGLCSRSRYLRVLVAYIQWRQEFTQYPSLQGYRSHQRVLQGEIVLLLADRQFVTPKSIKECCLFNKGHTEGDSVTIFNMGYTHQRTLPQCCTLSWMGALMSYTKSPNAKESKTKRPSDTAISGYVLAPSMTQECPHEHTSAHPFTCSALGHSAKQENTHLVGINNIGVLALKYTVKGVPQKLLLCL